MWGGHSAMTLFIPQVNAPQCMQWHAPLIRLNDLNSIVYLAVCVCVWVASFPGPRPASRHLQYGTEFYLGNVRASPGLEPPVVYRTASDGKLGEGLGTRLCVCVCVCVSPPLSIVHCSSYSVNTNPNIWHSSVYFSTWCGGTNEPSP